MLATVLYGVLPEPAYARVEVRLTDLAYSLKEAFRPVRAWGLEALPEQRHFPEILNGYLLWL